MFFFIAMAQGKRSFLLYCDIIHVVKKMPKDKQAELFMMILEYVNDMNPTTEDLLLEIAFEPIKQSLKRDLKKYEGILERNKKNGQLGGRPKKEPKKPSGLFKNPKNPEKPKKADSDSDNDNDSDNDSGKEDNNTPDKKKSGGDKSDFIQKIIEVWQKDFLEVRNQDYIITTIGKERQAAGKIAMLNKKIFPDQNTEDALKSISAMFRACLNIEDQWLYENMNMTTINSKFNTIKTKLNGNSKKRGTTNAELAEVLRRHLNGQGDAF